MDVCVDIKTLCLNRMRHILHVISTHFNGLYQANRSGVLLFELLLYRHDWSLAFPVSAHSVACQKKQEDAICRRPIRAL